LFGGGVLGYRELLAGLGRTNGGVGGGVRLQCQELYIVKLQ